MYGVVGCFKYCIDMNDTLSQTLGAESFQIFGANSDLHSMNNSYKGDYWSAFVV